VVSVFTPPLPAFRPRALLEQVAALDLDSCVATYGETPCLVVRLDAFSHDLELGLAALDAESEPPRERPVNQTLQLAPGMLHPLMRDLPRAEPLLSMVPPRPSDAYTAIGADFLSSPCYVLRLYPRTSPHGVALTVGRSTSHDIVLRHPSVSTVHARIDLSPRLRIRDAGSRNGTLLNGVPVDAHGADLHAGDHLKLGAVQATVCTAAALWHAAHGTPSP
jgi:FHA domain